MNGQGLSTKGVLFSKRRRLLRKLTFPIVHVNALVWWRVDHLVLVYQQFLDPRRVTRLQLPLNLLRVRAQGMGSEYGNRVQAQGTGSEYGLRVDEGGVRTR